MDIKRKTLNANDLKDVFTVFASGFAMIIPSEDSYLNKTEKKKNHNKHFEKSKPRV